jgi:hypothetical protein
MRLWHCRCEVHSIQFTRETPPNRDSRGLWTIVRDRDIFLFLSGAVLDWDGETRRLHLNIYPWSTTKISCCATSTLRTWPVVARMSTLDLMSNRSQNYSLSIPANTILRFGCPMASSRAQVMCRKRGRSRAEHWKWWSLSVPTSAFHVSLLPTWYNFSVPDFGMSYHDSHRAL